MGNMYKIPFLGRIPLEKCVERTGENGESIMEIDNVGTAGSAFVQIVRMFVSRKNGPCRFD